MKFGKIIVVALTALALTTSGAFSAGKKGKINDVDFSFEGPFGTYDEAQLRRGLQLYTEICAGCHGLIYVPIRTLSDAGGPRLPPEYVREYAKQFEVPDTSDGAEPGDTREAKPADHFPAGFDPNAPDLSLMAKARKGFSGPYGTGINQLFKGIGGAEYIASLLTGYTGEDKEEAGTLFYKNTAFSGGWTSMAPPLFGEDVEYEGGFDNSLQQEAEDIAAFLTWTAEPKMMERKRAGFIAIILLTMLTVLLYATNKRIWAPIKKQAKDATS